jgi:hypothetical protein
LLGMGRHNCERKNGACGREFAFELHSSGYRFRGAPRACASRRWSCVKSNPGSGFPGCVLRE